jgi:hypothetical protein
MNYKFSDLGSKELGATVLLLSSSLLFHVFKPSARVQQLATQQVSDRATKTDGSFSYVTTASVSTGAPTASNALTSTAASPTAASGLPPCPTPDQKGTGVLIEGDRPGETTGRKEKIEAVARQNRLAGKWCLSAKTRNATWNLDGISVDEALKAFNLFKEAGLVSLAHPTNSPTAGRVTWQRAGANGSDRNVSAEMQGSSDRPETFAPSAPEGNSDQELSQGNSPAGGPNGPMAYGSPNNCPGGCPDRSPMMNGPRGESPYPSQFPQRRNRPGAAPMMGRPNLPPNYGGAPAY